MTTDQTSHVSVRYKKCGGEITHTYSVNTETLRKFHRKRDWLGRHLRNRSDEKLDEWLEASGAQLDCPNGPASFTRAASGATTEKYYKDGELHRVGGPAYVRRNADGTMINEYWLEGGLTELPNSVGRPALKPDTPTPSGPA